MLEILTPAGRRQHNRCHGVTTLNPVAAHFYNIRVSWFIIRRNAFSFKVQASPQAKRFYFSQFVVFIKIYIQTCKRKTLLLVHYLLLHRYYIKIHDNPLNFCFVTWSQHKFCLFFGKILHLHCLQLFIVGKIVLSNRYNYLNRPLFKTVNLHNILHFNIYSYVYDV